MKKLLYFLIIVCLAGVLITACKSNNANIDKPQDSSTSSVKQTAGGSTKESEVQTASQTDNKVDNIISEMTLEEKVGQVFIMSLRNLKQDTPVRNMGDSVKNQIQQFHLGGIILFSENINTPSQTKELIDDMKKVSKTPLFMAVDEEGGATSRITASPLMHATKLPSNWAIGKTNDPEMAKKAGNVIGREIASLGFNMDFAPIADVNTNPQNPVIGERSFSADPQKAALMVAAEVEGLHEQNIIAVLKHFPGHGDTSRDSHTGAVIIEYDRKRLDNIEFVPFKSGMNAGAEGVMTAHIQMPKITGNSLPATLSKKILTDILRNDLGYEGLVITDALEMGAISQFWPADKSAVLAFDAGADILLMPYDLEAAYNGLLNAVKSGRIKEARLDESVRRILNAKQKRGILENKENLINPDEVLGCKEHKQIVEEILKK